MDVTRWAVAKRTPVGYLLHKEENYALIGFSSIGKL